MPGAPTTRAPAAALALLLTALPGPAARAAPGDRPAPAPSLPQRLLAIRHLPAPSPQTLRMRMRQVRARAGASPATAATAGAADAADTADGAPPSTGADEVRKQRRLLRALPLTIAPALEERVIFRFNIGFGLDGGQPSGQPMLTDAALPSDKYTRTRIYTFGDAVLGSRGFVVPSLSTYLAAQLHFDENLGRGFERDITAVPSVHDSPNLRPVLVRSGYAELDGPFDISWLEPLHVRAGRQYRYGPVVAHFDGLSVGYDTRALAVGFFAGQGVDLYGLQRGAQLLAGRRAAVAGGMAGLSLRLDLFALGHAPLVVSGNLLDYDDHSHADGTLALRWSRDMSLQAGVRALDGAMARQYMRVRARLSEVTVAMLDVDNRSRGDWMYDALAIEPEPTDPRRYLNLGPPLPRTYVSLRAGTVLLDNIDLLVRGGAAVEHRDRDEPASTFSASYAEAGASLEVRMRRTLAVGASVLARGYGRIEDPTEDAPAPGLDDMPGALAVADTGRLGERSFVEAGTTARFSLGARRFSADAEVYMRYYGVQPLYPDLVLEDTVLHGGARFSVEGWAGDRLRIKAEYEVSSGLAMIPELRGIKSLRVLIEARL